jgi:hypothetical protein
MRATNGAITVGEQGSVTVVDLELADMTVTSFVLGGTQSARISGAGSPTSAVTIEDGDHELNLQTEGFRPREGDAFCILTGFGSIAGAFDEVTTDITLGQQTDPNTGLPIPFFLARVVTDPNAPTKVAMQVVFRGLTAGDANGDHWVDGGDLSLVGAGWLGGGQGWGTGDFNGDAIVDGGDLSLMGANWSWSLPGGAPEVAIPEPASLVLLGLGALSLVRRRR